MFQGLAQVRGKDSLRPRAKVKNASFLNLSFQIFMCHSSNDAAPQALSVSGNSTFQENLDLETGKLH